MNFVQSSVWKNNMNKSSLKVIICVSGAIICAVIARILGKLDYAPITFGLIRSIIYIALYISWGISIRKRVVQMQVRRYLTAIAALMPVFRRSTMKVPTKEKRISILNTHHITKMYKFIL